MLCTDKITADNVNTGFILILFYIFFGMFWSQKSLECNFFYDNKASIPTVPWSRCSSLPTPLFLFPPPARGSRLWRNDTSSAQVQWRKEVEWKRSTLEKAVTQNRATLLFFLQAIKTNIEERDVNTTVREWSPCHSQFLQKMLFAILSPPQNRQPRVVSLSWGISFSGMNLAEILNFLNPGYW